MSTHEREIVEPVDLCNADGTVADEAIGWSRVPLHRANLVGRDGRNKRWDYWAVLAGDLVVSAVYSDVDHAGVADVWWADLVSGESGGHGIVSRHSDGIVLPDIPGAAPLVVERDGLDLSITDDAAGTHLRATWIERDGRPGQLDVTVALAQGHESVNVVIPWSPTVFNWTSKHQARPAAGALVVGDRRWTIGGSSGDAWGVLDVGRGRWPSEIVWNWGGGAGRAGDHVIGIQIGAKWTDGTGHTENGVIVDGRVTKIGDELAWEYDWEAPLEPWRVTSPDGRLRLVLSPRYDKHTRTAGSRNASEVHQVFGTWSGSWTTDEGVTIGFEGLQGFAEEARQRW